MYLHKYHTFMRTRCNVVKKIPSCWTIFMLSNLKLGSRGRTVLIIDETNITWLGLNITKSLRYDVFMCMCVYYSYKDMLWSWHQLKVLPKSFSNFGNICLLRSLLAFCVRFIVRIFYFQVEILVISLCPKLNRFSYRKLIIDRYGAWVGKMEKVYVYLLQVYDVRIDCFFFLPSFFYHCLRYFCIVS